MNLDYLECAKSSRSFCRVCDKNIEFDSVRGVTLGEKFVCLKCLPGEIDKEITEWYDMLAKLLGMRRMVKRMPEDKDKLKIMMKFEGKI